MAKVRCKECGGDGEIEVDCPDCDSTGCEQCEESGTILTDCKACEGTGEVDD